MHARALTRHSMARGDRFRAMPEELTAEQAAARLETDDTLGMPLGPGQPPAFLRALGEREDWTDLRVYGALLAVGVTLVGEGYPTFARILGFLALIMASVNIFGGFLVTQRMLAMYQKKK